MCWKSKLSREVKTADADIRVLKFCYPCQSENAVASAYEEKIYEFGKKYTDISSDIIYESINGVVQANVPINIAFHSYSEDCEIKIFGNIILIYAKNGHILDTVFDCAKCSCIIPKGARYIVNENDEYVSDEIIIESIEKNLPDYVLDNN